MKTALLSLIGLFLSISGLASEEPKQLVGTKELRNRCHAYLEYTTALAETSKKTRMGLLTKAVELDPHLARAFYNRGVLYANDGDLRRAKADFNKAVALNENYIYAHYNLACVHSLESRPDAALASLEKALEKGYQKFDKIPKDSDLKNIKENPAFAPLIAKYQAGAAKTKLSVRQRFQTADFDDRTRLLVEAIRKPDKEARDLAVWAMHEPDYELRVLSMQLWQKLDSAETKSALLRGLYDANGYVSKAASRGLIRYGKDIEPLMVWALEDKDTQAPFFSMQILAAIRATKSAEKILPLLRNDDPKVRIMAAESLARLRAASTLPQVEAALENAPKDKEGRESYKAAFRRAIAELKRVKEKREK